MDNLSSHKSEKINQLCHDKNIRIYIAFIYIIPILFTVCQPQFFSRRQINRINRLGNRRKIIVPLGNRQIIKHAVYNFQAAGSVAQSKDPRALRILLKHAYAVRRGIIYIAVIQRKSAGNAVCYNAVRHRSRDRNLIMGYLFLWEVIPVTNGPVEKKVWPGEAADAVQPYSQLPSFYQRHSRTGRKDFPPQKL